MRDAMSVLIRPVVSEKTYALMENHTLHKRRAQENKEKEVKQAREVKPWKE